MTEEPRYGNEMVPGAVIPPRPSALPPSPLPASGRAPEPPDGYPSPSHLAQLIEARAEVAALRDKLAAAETRIARLCADSADQSERLGRVVDDQRADRDRLATTVGRLERTLTAVRSQAAEYGAYEPGHPARILADWILAATSPATDVNPKSPAAQV